MANRRKPANLKRETLCITMPHNMVQWVRDRGGAPSTYLGKLVQVQMADDLRIAEEEAADLHARAAAADRRVESIRNRRAPVSAKIDAPPPLLVIRNGATEPHAGPQPPKPSVAMR